MDNLLFIGIPTKGIALTEVLEKELFSRTGSRVRKRKIDPTFIEMTKIDLEVA